MGVLYLLLATTDEDLVRLTWDVLGSDDIIWRGVHSCLQAERKPFKTEMPVGIQRSGSQDFVLWVNGKLLNMQIHLLLALLCGVGTGACVVCGVCLSMYAHGCRDCRRTSGVPLSCVLPPDYPVRGRSFTQMADQQALARLTGTASPRNPLSLIPASSPGIKNTCALTQLCTWMPRIWPQVLLFAQQASSLNFLIPRPHRLLFNLLFIIKSLNNLFYNAPEVLSVNDQHMCV